MKAETDPITADEYLLRLVFEDRFVRKTPEISRRAFEPRNTQARHPDTDGISMFREACLNSPLDCLVAISNESKYGIVRIPISHFIEQGLTVTPSIIDEVPGHVVIAELNADANPDDILAQLNLLAEIASRNIVRYPPSKSES